MSILGAPPEGDIGNIIQWFQPIVDAPQTQAEFFMRNPGVSDRVLILKSHGVELDRKLLQMATSVQVDASWADLKGRKQHTPENPEVVNWLKLPQYKAQRDAILCFVRAKVLREMNMEPAFMLELMRAFGPMDWRHPAAHSLYWSALGGSKAANPQGRDRFEIVQNDRLMLHSLQSLCFTGRLMFDPETGYYSTSPDLRFFDAYEKAIAEVAQRTGKNGQIADELDDNSYMGFLMWATEATFIYGSRKKADEYYAKLRQRYSSRWPALFTQNLDQFVTSRLLNSDKVFEKGAETVSALLTQGIHYGLVRGDSALANRFFEEAQRIHAAVQNQKQIGSSQLDRRQLELPPFHEMAADVLAHFMLAPDGSVHPQMKSRIWNRAPLEMRQRAYDRIKKPLYDIAARAGLSAEEAFSEPPGMAEFRRSMSNAASAIKEHSIQQPKVLSK